MSVRRIAIVAALPREVAPLVRGLRPAHPEQGVSVWDSAQGSAGETATKIGKSYVVVTAGMGAERAVRAVAAALASGQVTELVSVGLAGALRRGMDCGRVYQPNEVVDARTGERFACAMGEGTLVTAAAVAGVAEKQRLSQTYSADLVDMEAAAVARMAAQRQVPFRCVKAVSDAHDFELAAMARFVTSEGDFRTAAFAVYLLTHPSLWRPVRVLARNSATAIRNLNAELARQLT